MDCSDHSDSNRTVFNVISPLAHASSPGLFTPFPDFFVTQSLSRIDAFSAWGIIARFPSVSTHLGRTVRDGIYRK